jgi:hypothetical protein
VNLGDIEGDYVLDVLDAESGASRRRMLCETGQGSFGILDMYSKDDWLVVSDSSPIISVASNTRVVDSGSGKLVLYDLGTMKRRDELTFGHPVALKTFSADGHRLSVLTRDHTASVVDVAR